MIKALLVGPLATVKELKLVLKNEPELILSIVAVDAGLYVCEKARVSPLFSVGDFDSYFKKVKPSKKLPENCWILPKEKDRSDLAYALKLLLKEDFTDCIAIGFQGGRADHEYGTHLDFTEAAKEYFLIKNSGMRGDFYYLNEKMDLKLKLLKNQSVSIFPSEGVTSKIKCFGFKYGDRKKFFSITRTNGLSNIVKEEFQKIWCKTGSILIMVPNDESKRE